MRDGLEVERPADYLTRLAASDLGRAYKTLVLAELDVQPGATVVDLGCGPGADLITFAEAVGPTGRVLGIDNDPAAILTAAQAVSGYPQVDVQRADLHRLDVPQASVDRVHTDRVLQHVADPNAAVVEAARVLRAGGIAAFAEPDWETLVVDYPDEAIAAAYRRFILDRVVRNARVGRQIPRLCERNGLAVVRVIPVTAVFRDVTEADRLFGFQRVTDRAVEAGYLTATDGASWLDHLRVAPFFAAVTLFATFAER